MKVPNKCMGVADMKLIRKKEEEEEKMEKLPKNALKSNARN